MQNYTLELIADEGTCPFRGIHVPQLTETVTVQAEDLTEARNLAFVHMKMRPGGQLLHVYHNGEELFADDPRHSHLRSLNKAQHKVVRVINSQVTAREAFKTLTYIHTLPASHWFWSRPTAIRDPYTAGGALVHEAHNRQ